MNIAAATSPRTMLAALASAPAVCSRVFVLDLLPGILLLNLLGLLLISAHAAG
jgi:hypothetical protein